MTELVIALLAMTACVYGASSGAKLASRRNYIAFRDWPKPLAVSSTSPNRKQTDRVQSARTQAPCPRFRFYRRNKLLTITGISTMSERRSSTEC